MILDTVKFDNQMFGGFRLFKKEKMKRMKSAIDFSCCRGLEAFSGDLRAT